VSHAALFLCFKVAPCNFSYGSVAVVEYAAFARPGCYFAVFFHEVGAGAFVWERVHVQGALVEAGARTFVEVAEVSPGIGQGAEDVLICVYGHGYDVV